MELRVLIISTCTLSASLLSAAILLHLLLQRVHHLRNYPSRLDICRRQLALPELICREAPQPQTIAPQRLFPPPHRACALRAPSSRRPSAERRKDSLLTAALVNILSTFHVTVTCPADCSQQHCDCTGRGAVNNAETETIRSPGVTSCSF